MSNSGRKMSIPGWCTFAVIGGVLVVASGAFASATPQSKSEATLVPATEKADAAALIDQAGVAAVKPKAANSKQNSSLVSSTGAAASQEKISHDSASGLMSEDDSALAGGFACFCGTDLVNGLPFCFEDTLCPNLTPCGGGQLCPLGSACLANNCCPPPLDFGCVPFCPDGPACNNPGVCGTYQSCEGGGGCPKDEVVFIESCDALPIKVFGNTQGAGNDSLCRPSEDLIITFVILEAGNYTFDLTTNVDDPCMWDSYMFLVGGDACACNAADIIAFNDDCPSGGGCFGLSCIGPVNLQPGEYWIVVEGFGVADAGPVDLHITSECKPECVKDIVVPIPSCDEPPFKVFGNTIGAGDDSSCRPSEDLIITFDILEEGVYSFDLTANVDDPCLWDSYMYLVGGDACACNEADFIAFNDDCPGIGCFGLSCIGPVNLPPGEYWIVVEGFGAGNAGPVDLHITSTCKKRIRDFHTTCPPPAKTSVEFGSADIPPIPADFFGPGADPFVAFIELEGIPLDPLLTGDADTIIERLVDPLQQSEPVGAMSTIEIELVALSLTSTDPVTVTFNGGQNPEQWDMEISLSPGHVPPPGTLHATKTHLNGGIFDAQFFVQPVFTFTKVTNRADVRVLDTGLEGLPPLLLQGPDGRWVHVLHPNLNIIPPDWPDSISVFIPGVDEINPGDPSSQEIAPFATQSIGGGVQHTVCPAKLLGACCDKSQPGGVCQSFVPESACNTADPQIQWFKGEVCVEDGGTVDCPEHTGACCDGTTGDCEDGVSESQCACSGTACPCDCDINGDGICDPVVDLGLLLGCFGSPTPPGCQAADLNCDGSVDDFDLDVFFCLLEGGLPEECCPGTDQCRWEKDTLCSQLDPPCEEHTGACCDGCTGICTPDVPESVCLTAFCQPTWTKDADCANVDCFEHRGACCDGCSGVCTDDVRESECVEPQVCQPTWTKDADCALVDCLEHTGACCDGCSGVCTSGVRESDCVEPQVCQPTWTKDGDCGLVTCFEHRGACCDGTTGTCEDDVPESGCPTTETPPGIGTCVNEEQCASPCPAVGACQTDSDCGPGGVCLSLPDCLLPSFCTCDQGQWACTDDCNGQCAAVPNQTRWEKDTPCSELDPPCTEHTGACCNGCTGVCTDGVRQSDCVEPQFCQPTWTKDADCALVDCFEHTGACCDNATGDCVVRTESDCLSLPPPAEPKFFKDLDCDDPGVVCEGLPVCPLPMPLPVDPCPAALQATDCQITDPNEVCVASVFSCLNTGTCSLSGTPCSSPMAVCPDPDETCVGVHEVVLACDCKGTDECHPETVPGYLGSCVIDVCVGGANNGLPCISDADCPMIFPPVLCVGTCPNPFDVCELLSTDTDGDGLFDQYECPCGPPLECESDADCPEKCEDCDLGTNTCVPIPGCCESDADCPAKCEVCDTVAGSPTENTCVPVQQDCCADDLDCDKCETCEPTADPNINRCQKTVPDCCASDAQCTGQCEFCDTATNTCEPIIPCCGNGVVEAPEQCDGNLCPDGQPCNPDCTCPGPLNDDCQDRIDIFNGQTPFDTTGATTSGPPEPGCSNGGGPVNDIWYNYTAEFTGDINVTTCEQLGGSATFDTILVVYDGCDCAPLSPLLGCNDDDPNNPCGGGAGGFHSTIEVSVVAGNCYKIRVGGFAGADAGPGVLNISKKPSCGNGVLDPGEQCDPPGSPCPDGQPCNTDCTCPPPPPECGDGVIDPGEDCDPPGSACPDGQTCQDDCTCPAPPEPHEVWDMVWSEASIVQWGPAWWTINGVPICHTFPDGVKTGPDNPHDWDHIVCPGWPNDWHWDAWFDWFGIPAHISVWFEHFGPDDAVEIQLYCSSKWLEYSIQIDIGANIYTLTDVNGIPFWSAPWSDGGGFAGGGYPGNLPPGFDPTGNTRGNQLMCDDCRFDIDGDGDVNAFDLANLLGGWGCPVAHNIVCFDVNMNNCIEAFDLANLLGSWGPCP